MNVNFQPSMVCQQYSKVHRMFAVIQFCHYIGVNACNYVQATACIQSTHFLYKNQDIHFY